MIVGSTAAARNKLSVASVLTPLDEDGKCNHGHGPGERVSACGVSFHAKLTLTCWSSYTPDMI